MRRVLLAFLVTTTAHAETRPVDGTLSLAVDNHALWAVKGKQRARLAGAEKFKTLTIDKARRKLTVDVEDNTCAGNTKYDHTFAELEARIENWTAFAAYKAKNLETAATGFAKAVALDPAWPIAAYNLAAARQLLGDQPAAIAALAPHLAKSPYATYLQVSMDPELSPLLDRPELAKLRAATPGTAVVTEAGLQDALYAKASNLIAYTRHEGDGGSAQFEIELQLWDARTGKLVASSMLVQMTETRGDYPGGLVAAAKKPVADRAARLQAMLIALGFGPGNTERANATESEDRMKAYFPKAKLGVVATAAGIANVLRGNTKLGGTTGVGRMSEATLVNDAKAVVLRTQLHAIESGCEAGPEIGVFVIPIP